MIRHETVALNASISDRNFRAKQAALEPMGLSKRTNMSVETDLVLKREAIAVRFEGRRWLRSAPASSRTER